jgi:putative SOS response-associated peptidase YedK
MALGHPLEEPLKIYPVSDLVNSPKTDDARCIEPVAIDRDFSSGSCGEIVDG